MWIILLHALACACMYFVLLFVFFCGLWFVFFCIILTLTFSPFSEMPVFLTNLRLFSHNWPIRDQKIRWPQVSWASTPILFIFRLLIGQKKWSPKRDRSIFFFFFWKQCQPQKGSPSPTGKAPFSSKWMDVGLGISEMVHCPYRPVLVRFFSFKYSCEPLMVRFVHNNLYWLKFSVQATVQQWELFSLD